MTRKFLIIIVLMFSLSGCQFRNQERYKPRAIKLHKQAFDLMKETRYDSAMVLLRKALEIDESYYQIHQNIIDIYLDRKEYQNAIDEAEIVIQKKPDLAEGWFFAGILNEYQGNKETARKYYHKSIELFTERINHLTGHLKINKKDFATEKALVSLVGKRRKLLDYLKNKDIVKYRELIKELGIRK